MRLLLLLPLLAGLVRTETAASCFCQLEGELADCPCPAATVDTFNSAVVRPLLLPLLGSYYFRYFQVDFNRPCLHWAEEEMQCTSPGCAVAPCNEEEVPGGLRDEPAATYTVPGPEGAIARAARGLLSLLPAGLEPYYQSAAALLASWGRAAGPCTDPHPVDPAIPAIHRNLLANEFCPLDPLEEGAACQYIDLAANEERFTGYSGRAAHRVWEKVYDELCFHPERDDKSFDVTSENMKSMCFEKRAFYRVVSGLHASIAVHLTSRYLLQQGGGDRPAVWGRNTEEFARRFSPDTTDGEGPERLKNLYFLYLLELRAIAKAAPVLRQIVFASGDKVEDSKMEAALAEVLAAVEGFRDHFDETAMFKSGESGELLAAFKENFRGISLLMDCLGCERCKVWGKLQVTGIGTALKVLFTEPAAGLALSRHEVVALLNAFGRVSTSIHELAGFREALGSS
jgi:ERO1-like protein alpha